MFNRIDAVGKNPFEARPIGVFQPVSPAPAVSQEQGASPTSRRAQEARRDMDDFYKCLSACSPDAPEHRSDVIGKKFYSLA